MSKITSKYQVTVPKVIAEEYGIQPGDEIEWVPAGEVIRVIPANRQTAGETTEERLRLFDQASGRLRRRVRATGASRPQDRGWTREDLYSRGRAH